MSMFFKKKILVLFEKPMTLKENVTIFFIVVLCSCNHKYQEEKAQNNSVVSFSQEEEEILISGIESFLYESIKTDDLYKISDYLWVETLGNFSGSYSDKDSIDILAKEFIRLNKKNIGKPFIFNRIENIEMLKREKLDSLQKTGKSTDFWYRFHNTWYPDKAGIIEISKPVIKEDKAFFWFSNMENGKSGRIMKVWMRKNNNNWDVEKGKVVIWF